MITSAQMDIRGLGELIRQHASKMIEDEPGHWRFEFDDRVTLVMADEAHNRMRILTPVADVESIPSEKWRTLMEANFDRALDARYCVNGDALWSAFIHPLRPLSPSQFLSGLQQVVELGRNYGSSYCSGALFFSG